MPICSVIGNPPPTISYVNQYLNSTPATTQNFTSVPLGTEHPSRNVFVAMLSDVAVTSVTVNGVAASFVVQSAYSKLYRALVPTGTSVTITVVRSASLGLAISVWTSLYINNLTPLATAADDTGINSTYNISANVNTVGNGIVLAYAIVAAPSGSPTMSLTGVTTNGSLTPTASILRAGSNVTTTASTPLAITASGSATVGSLAAIVSASYY